MKASSPGDSPRLNPASRRRVVCALAAAAAVPWIAARASLREITIARTADYSGVASSIGLEQVAGAKLVLSKVNAVGGVHGHSIRLLEADDAFDPVKAAANARKFNDDGVLALLLVQGTSPTLKLLEALKGSDLPVVAPFTGAHAIYHHEYPNLFRLRASYDQEIAALVRHFTTIGWNRVAVLAPDNEYGASMRQAVERAMKPFGISPAALVNTAQDGSDTAAAVATCIQKAPQVIIVTSFGAAATRFISEYRLAGGKAQLATLSLVTQQQIQSLGHAAVGLMTSQVMPLPKEFDRAVVREFVQDAHTYGKGLPLSFLSLEGYVAARFLVEGIRRSTAAASRAALARSIASIRNFDLGGLTLDLSEGHLSASNFVDIMVVDSTLQFRK